MFLKTWLVPQIRTSSDRVKRSTFMFNIHTEILLSCRKTDRNVKILSPNAKLPIVFFLHILVELFPQGWFKLKNPPLIYRNKRNTSWSFNFQYIISVNYKRLYHFVLSVVNSWRDNFTHLRYLKNLNTNSF